MNSLKTLLILLFLLPKFMVFAGSKEPAHERVTDDNPPNIIFILTDDQRWDALGYAGNEVIQTPEMDRLAEEGCYFSQAMVTTPICSASRASIFSGVHERAHRYTFQTGPISEALMQTSYPRILRDAGYTTAFFGKFGVNYRNMSSLFDVLESYDRNNRFKDHRGYYYKTLNGDTVHLTRYTGQKALDFIESAPKDKPFCLSLSFSAPHAHDGAEAQYFWQETSDALYQDMEMAPPRLGEDTWFHRLPQAVREGFNRTRWHWRYDTPEKYQHSVKGYYRMIHGIDLEIGKIRRKLEAKGLADNTVIMLMGDNGYFLGERQLAGKWLMYDNSVRVPLIIHDPRVRKHRDISEMALNVDVPATMLDLAGVSQPDTWQGKSLYPIVAGKEKSLEREAVLIEHLWEFVNIPPSEGVRTDDWKYLRYVNDPGIEELYDLKKDPEETVNLAGDPKHEKTLASLREKCDELGVKYSAEYIGVPEGLRVEYIRDPSAALIRDPLPEYSWIVPDGAGYQKAYQVLVSSSRELIDRNEGDVWSSGQVRSAESVNVTHGGIALQPGRKYYWKVRLWDRDNRLTDYTPAQMFRTGDFEGTVSTPNVFQAERIAPAAFKKYAEDSYFIDFGKDAFGNLEISYESDKGSTLTIRLGEKLKNGRIDRDPGGHIRYQQLALKVKPGKHTYLLDLPADERNTGPKAVQLPDSFGVVTPFRYCEIEGADKLSGNDVRQIAWFHYFEDNQSFFNSSDTTLNQIWELCKYSMKATSFMGLYIDGDRERIPYEADAYINQLGHYGTDAEYAMAKQTLEWFMDHPTWPTEWLLHTAMMAYQDYYYTGDLEIIRHYYELMKRKTLEGLSRDDGLITTEHPALDGSFMQAIGFKDTSRLIRDIVDWPAGNVRFTGTQGQLGERDGHEMMPVNTVVNCFFYYNMVLMSELAGLLDKPEDQDWFDYMAAKSRRSINSKLFDPEKGIYIDGEGSTHSSLHSNMLPLAFGIVPESWKASVASFVKSRGMACSVYGSQYLMEALYIAGEADYALDLMLKTDDRSWWNMIASGSTITLEAWDFKYKPNLDWNHAWGGAPANIIPRWLWGIRPVTAGFGSVIIQPQMAELEHAEITCPTIRGPIEATYQRSSARSRSFSIEIPANMNAWLILDDADDSFINRNGKQADLVNGKLKLEPGKNSIDIRINSF